MEENENISFVEKTDLILDEQAKTYLGVSAKWAKFISIIMFVMIALIVLIGVSMPFAGFSPLMSNDLSGLENDALGGSFLGFKSFLFIFLSVFYIAIGLLMLYPALKLYRFSEKTQIALRRNDSEILKSALENHKSYFKFTGTMILVVIGIYIVMIIGMIIKLTF